MGDVGDGDHYIDWIQRCCRIPEGKFVGQKVVLREWQRDIIRGVYDDHTRRALISFGRKNAKTSLAAFLLLLHLCGPAARHNSQLYSAAQSRDQAAILFALAAKIVRMSPHLSAVVGIRDTAKQLYCQELGTLYRALSAEASTAYGLSPVFVVHDELGQVKGPRSELYDALETAGGAQESPLSVVISTQAPTDADLLSILIDDAKRGEDPTTKLFMYSAPEDIDPFSDEALIAANPALGDFLNETEVRAQAEAARRMPAREASYRNLVLNQRVNQHSPFMPAAIWKRAGRTVLKTAFEHAHVYAGLDLSARHDLTALVYIALYRDEWHVHAEFFAPADGVYDRAQRDRVPYDLWADKGYITLTPGASVDYSFVAARLIQLREECDLQAIAFDRWRIDVLQKELAEVGAELPLVPFGQGYRDMAPALDATEGEFMNDRVRHGNNPVLTWCAANAIAVADPAGNRKLDKSKSTGRIDGMVAFAMAMGQAFMVEAQLPSIYESRGIRAI